MRIIPRQVTIVVVTLLTLSCGKPAHSGQVDSATALVRLPRLISDGMILQRNQPVKVWGWAPKGERVAVHFVDTSYGTVADSSGAWSVTLHPHREGAPYEMQVNAITIRNVLIGDVWVCSGQSNMELPVSRVLPLYRDEIDTAHNPSIREFTVPQVYDFRAPHDDMNGGTWQAVTPENVLTFSAVGYFFAQELYKTHHVPIGIINASLGGSPAQAWMSEAALEEFPHYHAEEQRFKDSTLIRTITQDDHQRIKKWYTELREKDAGYRGSPWCDPSVDVSGWPRTKVPGFWADSPLGPVHGVVWFRKDVTIPAKIADRSSMLLLGTIVDADSVFMNGVFVGTTSYQYPPRRYELPAHTLKAGTNSIVVRVINSAGRGGFVPGKEYLIWAGADTVDLSGDWHYRLGATMKPLAPETFIRWQPGGLYNGMLAPLLNFRIRGVAWYQGESNAEKPVEYRALFPAMIRDWRAHWQQGNVPFVFAQLPNFMEARSEPSESNWAMMREAQLMTLSLPSTAMAVTIDIGEWNDIHPLDKKDVGYRLALAARSIAYGESSLVSSGPLYDRMTVSGDTAWISFTSAGTGLTSRGKLTSFAIAGADRHFVWANARIVGDSVAVWNSDVTRPVAVRYAWADDPPAPLYNNEGLPASPFRTDHW